MNHRPEIRALAESAVSNPTVTVGTTDGSLSRGTRLGHAVLELLSEIDRLTSAVTRIVGSMGAEPAYDHDAAPSEYVFCHGYPNSFGMYGEPGHEDGCPWQALVALAATITPPEQGDVSMTSIDALWRSGHRGIRQPEWAPGEWIELTPNPLDPAYYVPIGIMHSMLDRDDIPAEVRVPPREVALWMLPSDGWKPAEEDG